MGGPQRSTVRLVRRHGCPTAGAADRQRPERDHRRHDRHGTHVALGTGVPAGRLRPGERARHGAHQAHPCRRRRACRAGRGGGVDTQRRGRAARPGRARRPRSLVRPRLHDHVDGQPDRADRVGRAAAGAAVGDPDGHPEEHLPRRRTPARRPGWDVRRRHRRRGGPRHGAGPRQPGGQGPAHHGRWLPRIRKSGSRLAGVHARPPQRPGPGVRQRRPAVGERVRPERCRRAQPAAPRAQLRLAGA